MADATFYYTGTYTMNTHHNKSGNDWGELAAEIPYGFQAQILTVS